MFRTFRSLPHLLTGVLLLGLLAACNNPGPNNPPNSTPIPNPPPAPNVPVACGFPTKCTPMPPSGPTIDSSAQVGLSILNKLPTQIGRFTLNTDPKKTYVGQNVQSGEVDGVVAVYDTAKGNELYVSIWLTHSTNDAYDRYAQQLYQLHNLFQTQVFTVELGDEAVVAPFVKPDHDGNMFLNA